MTFLEACRACKAVRRPAVPDHRPVRRRGGDRLAVAAGFLAKNARCSRPTSCWSATPACGTSTAGDHHLAARAGRRRGHHQAANRDLHSGLSAAPPSIRSTCSPRILGGSAQQQRRSGMPGFYDGVEELPAEIAEQWNELGFDAEAFLGAVGLTTPAGERDRTPLEQLWSRPTCDINGIVGGYTARGFQRPCCRARRAPKSPSGSSPARTRSGSRNPSAPSSRRACPPT